jgi:hypothetical protein
MQATSTGPPRQQGAHGARCEDGAILPSCSLKSNLEKVFNKHHLGSIPPPESVGTTSLDLRVDDGQFPVQVV